MKIIAECGMQIAEINKKIKKQCPEFKSEIRNRNNCGMQNVECGLKNIKLNDNIKGLYSESKSAICNPKSAIRTGFTLIEIMVVVVIIGLLAAIVSPKFMVQLEKAKLVQAKTQIRNLEQALKLFKLDCGFYPSTEQGLKALVEKPTIGKIPENYAEGGYLEKGKVPLDAWGNPYIYLCPGLLNYDYDIISLGRDGKEGGENFDADIYSWDME